MQAQISVDHGEWHSGRGSLKIVFKSPTNLGAINVSQLVVVEPDVQYRLECYARTDDLRTAGPPIVEIRDASDSAILATSQPLPDGTNKWQPITVEFKTGPQMEGRSIETLPATCRILFVQSLGLFGMTTSISNVPAAPPSSAMMPAEPATKTPPLHAERPQTFASRFVFLTICVAVVMTTLAFGTVHYWALAVFALSAVLIICFGAADAGLALVADRLIRAVPLLGLIVLLWSTAAAAATAPIRRLPVPIDAHRAIHSNALLWSRYLPSHLFWRT